MPMLHRSMNLDRSPAATRFDPERMFRPRSLAVVGTEGRVARQLLANLDAGAFAGPIQVAQPGEELSPADLAILTGEGVPVRPVLAGLARAGIYAGVALGMSMDIAAAQAETGVHVLGPGSFGVACPSLGLNATLSHLKPKLGRVALVSQSAALCRAVLDWAEPNGVGFSQIVGIGGNAGTGFNQVLDFLSRDSATGPILLDIRRIRDARQFLSAARAAARLRPVLALRAGSRLMDPTGRAEMVFDAALNRAGVLTVSRLDELLAALETLTRAPSPRCETIAIVTNAIGPGRMAADAALANGITLAELAPETRDVLRLRFPGGDATGIVYVGVDEPTRLAEAAAMLAGAREVGCILTVMAPTGPADQAGVESLAALAATKPGAGRVPLLVCAMGETTGAAHRRRLAEAGVPVFASPEQAVQGFQHLLSLRRARAAAQELPSSAVLDLAPDRAAVRAIIGELRASERLELTATEIEALLGVYGLANASPPLDISVTEDALFGPAIGLGGGRMGDRAFDLPPLNLSLAAGLVAHAPAARRLTAEQAQSLIDALVRTSQLVVDVPELLSLSFGPGGVPQAALRPPGQRSAMAIPPYPADLAEEWDASGEALIIRPIRPEDAEAHAAMFARLTPEDVRYRFFSSIRQLSPERIARMTQVDYDREMAFVAVRANGDTVGVGRLVCDGDTGEFAVVVERSMKGKGIARRLMQRLIDWGRSQGMTAIVGQVLSDNAPMLAFMRKLGFSVHRSEEDPELVEARMDLARGRSAAA